MRSHTERNPDVFSMLELAVTLGVGYAVLVPGPDGRNAIQRLVGALQTGLTFGPFVGGPGTPSPSPILPPSPVTRPPSPQNADVFNINLQESTAEFGIVSQNWSAHAAIGHAGRGGDFICTFDARGGGFAGFGATGWVRLGQQTFATNGDNDWTGYGVDLGPTPNLERVPAISVGGRQIKIAIFAPTEGPPFAEATIDVLTRPLS
jgi:hypothetical protein